MSLVGENLGIHPAKLPGMKEGGPIEDLDDVGEGNWIPDFLADALGCRESSCRPVNLGCLLLRIFKWEVDGGGAFPGVEVAIFLLLRAIVGEKILLIDRNLLIQGFFTGASVRPGLRGCRGRKGENSDFDFVSIKESGF